MPITLRILIVEDDVLIRTHLKKTFHHPAPEWISVYGAAAFEVFTAATAKQAREMLASALSTHRPFDIVLFDLGLPRDENTLDDHDDPRAGLEVLQEIQQQQLQDPRKIAAHVIVVATAHRRVEVLEELLKTQIVADFVGKPFDEKNEIPYRRVMDATIRYRAKQENEWARRSSDRVRKWCAGIALHHALYTRHQLITESVSTACAHMRRLQDLMEESCNLSANVDVEVPLVRQLAQTQNALEMIQQVSRKAIEPNNMLSWVSHEAARASLKQMIDNSLRNVRSGCVVKGICVDVAISKDALVDAPTDAVAMLMEEILHGIIDANDRGATIQITTLDKTSSVEVSFKDSGPALSDDALRRIDAEIYDNFDVSTRISGLALAKFVSWSIGAVLNVTTLQNGSGNIVTLCLTRSTP